MRQNSSRQTAVYGQEERGVFHKTAEAWSVDHTRAGSVAGTPSAAVRRIILTGRHPGNGSLVIEPENQTTDTSH
jgi:hypothetical protein